MIPVPLPAEIMRASSDLTHAAIGLRWTPGWVLLVSVLAPASAWSLHTVQPDLVAWYVGALCWLTLTPERRPRWMSIRATVVEPAPQAAKPAAAPTLPATALVSAVSANTEATAAGEKEAGKAKAVTLAEMKSLTGGADRAVVWSQVGPGKFVRQPGEENADGETDDFGDNVGMPGSGNMVIEAVATTSALMDETDE